uniref:Variant surface glycoprotein 1689 n=1 Tax=Trypanosoma brucei TaxID=5691 RepID=M4SW14_9TRYP|nr:variant surface glycoprotein 1689 [Trypanosoma brucei]
MLGQAALLIVLTSGLTLATKVEIQHAHLLKACSVAGEFSSMAGHAANEISRLLTNSQQLWELADDLIAVVRDDINSNVTAIAILAEIARKEAIAATTTVNDNLDSTIKLAAMAAQLAGNIQEAAHIIVNSANSRNSECLSSTAGFTPVALSAAATPGCLKSGGDYEDFTWNKNKVNLTFETTLNSLPADSADEISVSATTCKLLHNAGERRTTGGDSKPIMAGLIRLGAAASNPIKWDEGKTLAKDSNSRFGQIKAQLKALNAALSSESKCQTQLMQLTTQDSVDGPVVEIDKGTITKSWPPAKQTITAKTTGQIRKLKKYRKV